MIWFIVIFSILPLIAGVIATIYAIQREKIDFHNGKCIYCGEALKLFIHDSQGGRGYKCTGCGEYVAWVSYPCVDKNYIKEKNKR